MYVFYFPLPALFVAAFSVVFPYAVAFKLVTVLGPRDAACVPPRLSGGWQGSEDPSRR